VDGVLFDDWARTCRGGAFALRRRESNPPLGAPGKRDPTRPFEALPPLTQGEVEWLLR